MTAVRSCWGSTPANAPRWRRTLARAPSLVAEEFSPVADPLLAWLTPGPAAAPAGVASALARALLPPEAEAAPPPWLRHDQRLSFRRVLAAVSRFGGALLADGVGTGKTYVALAVAAALEPGLPVHVLAPAVLRSQWNRAAARAEVSILFHSHETLSRGRPPSPVWGPAIVDESHRFRVPSTRRYHTLARWCSGRRGILASATPVVNRLEEVAHQLLLFVPDDALAWNGIASLRRISEQRGAGTLAHLVLTGEDRSASLPERAERVVRASAAEAGAARRLLGRLRTLRLSSEPATAALLRVTLLRALASSPAALSAALARYQALLLHARDASASGSRVCRQAIRAFVGADQDQLVLWPLVAEDSARVELALDDLDQLAAIRRATRRRLRALDPKAAVVRRLIADGKRTVIFTTSVATAMHLRHALGNRGVAWCTGQGSGLDIAAAPREVVLDWFRREANPERPSPRPKVLVATDVASEGLDLPLIERVVHYDLPWTMVRLEQRGGRALRLSSGHARVEMVRCLPPAPLDAELRLTGVLRDKAALPAMLGLGSDAEAPWRRRAWLAARWEGRPPVEGIAAVTGPARGGVVGVRIVREDGATLEAVWAREAGRWTGEEIEVSRLLDRAYHAEPVSGPVPAHRMAALLRGIAPQVRQLLRACQGTSLAAPAGPAAARLRRRLLALTRAAARRRDGDALLRLANAFRTLRRGLTAGEALTIRRWASISDRELMAELARLPPEPAPTGVLRAEVIGILLVEPDADPG